MTPFLRAIFLSAIVLVLISACVSSTQKQGSQLITISNSMSFPKSTIQKFRRDCLTTPMAIMKSPDIPPRRYTLTREFVETDKGTPKDNLYCRFENARLGEVLKFIDDNDVRKICPRVHILNHTFSPTEDELVAVAKKIVMACAPE